jgi:hypothetical protein
LLKFSLLGKVSGENTHSDCAHSLLMHSIPTGLYGSLLQEIHLKCLKNRHQDKQINEYPCHFLYVKGRVVQRFAMTIQIYLAALKLTLEVRGTSLASSFLRCDNWSASCVGKTLNGVKIYLHSVLRTLV